MKHKLKDICEGITDGSHNPPSGGPVSNFMMISSKNVFDDCITYDEPRFLTEEQFNIENKRTNISAGDILMTIVGTVGRVAVVDSNTRKITLQRSVAVLHPNNKICNSRYLMYSLRSKRKFFESEAHGVAQKGIYLKQLSEIYLNIPEKEKQNNIVRILDNVCDIITLRKQQLENFDNLIKARFVEMFGDPVSNPKGWEKKALSDEADIKIGPFGSLLHKEDYISGGHALVNPSHIIDGKISPDNDLTISDEKYDELSAYHLHEGDVVMGRRGEMGRCAVVGKEGFLCGTGSLLIRSKGNLSADYIQKIISFPSFKRTIEDMAVGQTMPNLNVPIVSAFQIIAPPKNVQDLYYNFVAQVDKSKVVVQKALDEAQLLFESLMQEYFG